MSIKDYKAMPVYEYQNNQNRQNVDRAMKEADNSPVKTSGFEVKYAAAAGKFDAKENAEGQKLLQEAREEAKKVKDNVCKDYDNKKSELETKYKEAHEKVDEELKGRENKEAHNNLNNEQKREEAALDKQFNANINAVQEAETKGEDRINSENKSVARSI